MLTDRNHDVSSRVVKKTIYAQSSDLVTIIGQATS